MNLGESVSTCYAKYFTFRGRASRSEFWWFYLFTTLISMILNMYYSVTFGPYMVTDPATQVPLFNSYYWVNYLIQFFGLWVPIYSATARRLHDIGRSGWWWLINFTIIGIFFFIYWLAKPSDEQKNKYNID